MREKTPAKTVIKEIIIIIIVIMMMMMDDHDHDNNSYFFGQGISIKSFTTPLIYSIW